MVAPTTDWSYGEPQPDNLLTGVGVQPVVNPKRSLHLIFPVSPTFGPPRLCDSGLSLRPTPPRIEIVSEGPKICSPNVTGDSRTDLSAGE